jgi:hypothetical protein
MIKKDYIKTARFLDLSCGTPTDAQIEEVKKIEARLEEKPINRAVNRSVKDGYTMAVDMLRRRQKDYSGIESLSSTRARAIAALAADFLNGECSADILCHVPIER